MAKVVIGVDIGLKGAIAVLNAMVTDSTGQNNREALIWDMPTVKVKKIRKRRKPRIIRTYDINRIRDILSRIAVTNLDDDVVCFVEEAQILPKGFTIKSNTGLARCQALFEGVLTGLHIEYHVVPPKDWQVAIGLTGKKCSGDANVVMAQKCHPNIEFKTPKGRVLDGRADALLIAAYGKDYW